MQQTSDDPIATLKKHLAGVEDIPVRVIVDGETIDAGAGTPGAILTMSAATLGKILSGESDQSTLYMTGALKIEGDINIAIAFGQALEQNKAPGPAAAAGDRNDNITFLDNVGLIALDLDRARESFARLGFNLAARGRHQLERPAGVFTPWGTGNHCANFANGSYLEIIGHVEPELPAGLYGDQLSRHGNHWGKITVHSLSNESEVKRLKSQGYFVADPAYFYRYNQGDSFSTDPKLSKKTSLISYPTSFADGFMLIGTEHFENEFPPGEGHCNHPNGVRRIDFALIAAREPEAAARRYAAALSIRCEKADPGWRIRLHGPSDIRFIAFDELPSCIASQLGDLELAVAAVGYCVNDIAQTRAFLEAAGVPLIKHPLGLLVAEPVAGAGATFFVGEVK